LSIWLLQAVVVEETHTLVVVALVDTGHQSLVNYLARIHRQKTLSFLYQAQITQSP
jgi:hypothetical protein